MKLLRVLPHAISMVSTVLGRDKADVHTFRQKGGASAIIFVHGFSGELRATWGEFPSFLLAEGALRGWDVYSYGYPTSFRLDIPGIWAADPSLDTLAEALRARLLHSPFKDYESLAIIAHSMGGLVVQRALLEKVVWQRISDVILFGCPSNGCDKARIAWKRKNQLRDLAPGSGFITKLRTDWSQTFASEIPFHFLTVAGRMDQLVGTDSSLDPFPKDNRRVIPGNHLQIVKPVLSTEPSVRIVVETLQGHAAPVGRWDSALVAGENRRFRKVVELLAPNEEILDEQATIELALAYDALGQNDKAIAVLEGLATRGITLSDPYGVLGGRFKRQWLVYRKDEDWRKALESYDRGLKASLTPSSRRNPSQAMYHSINMAFLELMKIPAAEERIPSKASAHAATALEYAQLAEPNQWSHATIGEAHLYLHDIEASIAAYRLALDEAKQREILSMYTQALAVAERIGGRKYVEQIMAVFGQAVEGTVKG